MTTLAGKWDLNDHSPTATGLRPRGILIFQISLCVDSNGVMYVADTSNSVIRKITPVLRLQLTATLSPADKTLLLSGPPPLGAHTRSNRRPIS